MKSRFLMLLTAIALFAALVNPVHLGAQEQQNKKQSHYTVTFLGNLGGSFSAGDGLNNRGSVAGTSFLSGDTTVHAFWWRKGVMTDLGTLGGPSSAASEGPMINNKDEVVGFSDTLTLDPNAENCFGGAFGDPPTPYTCVPFVWRDGVMTALPLLGGNNGDAAAINNRGQVAGLAEKATRDPNCPFLHFEPVIWENGQISQQLPTISGDPDGFADAINDQGQAVGFTGNCGFVHAVLWEKGKATDLGSLGGVTGNAAYDINNRGQVVGASELAGDTTQHAFLWQDGVMTDLGTLPGFPGSLTQAINNQGQAVGYADDFNGTVVALLWHDGVMTDLNTLVPGGGSTLFLLEALGINDRGQIAVQAYDANSGDCCAFLLTPAHGEATSDTVTVAPGETSQRPKFVLPENVRKMLQKRPGFGHLGLGR
jgi:probable HAF family extracellular repeat protein